MKLLVHTATKNGTTIPLLRLVEFHNPSPEQISKARETVGRIKGLSKDTVVKSQYEALLRDCLVEFGIPSSYEPFSLILNTALGRGRTYTPDFVTNIFVAKRQVIIDPHIFPLHKSNELAQELGKFRLFQSRFNDRYYVIICSHTSKDLLSLRVALDLSFFMDDYWEIPKLAEKSGPEEMGHAKGVVKEHLAKLLRNAKVR